MKPSSARNFGADVFGKSLTSFDIWGEDDDGAFDKSLVSNSSFDHDLKDDWTIETMETEETTNSTGRSSLDACSTPGSGAKGASARLKSSRRESGKSKDGTKRSSSSKNTKSLNDLFDGKAIAELISVIGDEGEKSIMSLLTDEGKSVKTSQSERSHKERKEKKSNDDISLDDTKVETSKRQVSRRMSSGSAKRSSDPDRGIRKTTSMQQPRRRRLETGAIQEEEEEEVVGKGPPKRSTSMIGLPSKPASMRQLANPESQEGSTRGVARTTSMESRRASRRPSSSRQLMVNRESHEEDEASNSSRRHVGRSSSMNEQRPRKPQSMRLMATTEEDEDGTEQRPRKPQSMRLMATSNEDEDDTEQRPRKQQSMRSMANSKDEEDVKSDDVSRRGVSRSASMQGTQRSSRHLRNCAEQSTDGKEQWPRKRIARGASFKASNGIM
jgi:hypothetical protein